MNFRNKIAAFTLMELVVVMLLSTFVFVMGLTAFQITNKLFQNYEEVSEESLDLDEFRSILTYDIYEAEAIYLRNGQLICERANLVISYQFGEAVVRTADIEDTKKDTVWQGTITYEGSFEENLETNGPIDQLTLELTFMEQPLSMSFRKPKDAAYYFQQQN